MNKYTAAPSSASGQLELIPEPTPDPPDDDFSPENPDLLIPCQPATKVYINRYSQVVICQDRTLDQDDEPAYCYFNPDSLMTLIDRLTDLAGIPSVGKPYK
jgi:hypothetical protein